MAPREFARRITHQAESGVVDALDVENARNFLDVKEDFFKLLAVADIEEDFDASVQLFADALEVADVGRGVADGGGDLGQHAGAVFGEDPEMHRKGRIAQASPLD